MLVIIYISKVNSKYNSNIFHSIVSCFDNFICYQVLAQRVILSKLLRSWSIDCDHPGPECLQPFCWSGPGHGGQNTVVEVGELAQECEERFLFGYRNTDVLCDVGILARALWPSLSCKGNP